MCRVDLKAPAPGVSFIFAIKGLPFPFPFKALNSTCSDLPEHPRSRQSKGTNRISQPWLGLGLLGEHPAAQDVTLLLSPHHTLQVTAHQEHWQQRAPIPVLCLLPACSCLQKEHGNSRAAPSSTIVHKTLYLLCSCRGSGPWGHPALPRVLPWDKSSQEEEEARRRKKEIKASLSNRDSINQKLFYSRSHLSQGS